MYIKKGSEINMNKNQIRRLLSVSCTSALALAVTLAILPFADANTSPNTVGNSKLRPRDVRDTFFSN